MTVCFKRFFAFLTDYREFVILVSHSLFVHAKKQVVWSQYEKRSELDSNVSIQFSGFIPRIYSNCHIYYYYFSKKSGGLLAWPIPDFNC